MLVFGLIREDAFKIASVAAHDWSMMQDGDIHLLDLQRAKIRVSKNAVFGLNLLPGFWTR